MNKKFRYASFAIMLVMALGCTTTQVWADQQLRLSARQNKRINGFEAELRGDYREKSGRPDRLNSEVEKINIPVGTPVAFCLSQNGVKTLLGVGRAATVSGVPVATVELETNDGDVVPNVEVGNILEAHQRTSAPFNSNPNCGSNLLISALFQK